MELLLGIVGITAIEMFIGYLVVRSQRKQMNKEKTKTGYPKIINALLMPDELAK